MELLTWLFQASPRDFAAAGFGCSRDIDHGCPDPPACGTCDTFYGDPGRDRVRVTFAAGRRHRAVFWAADKASVRLWVDGVPVGVGVELDTLGTWIDGRFLVVHAMGPSDHPDQEYGPGDLVTRIVSVLVYDADRAATIMLVPGPDERWTRPHVTFDGQALRVYPDPTAGPDRTLPVD
jgi:hypothetical protein